MPASGRAAPPSAGGILLLLLTAGGAAAALAVGPSQLTGGPIASAGFPPDFGARAYAHVVSIVGASPRPASSAGERKVAIYVQNQFRRMGLKVAVEEFEFGSYEIESAQLHVGGLTCRPSLVAFNPYAGVFRFEGVATLVERRGQDSGALPDVENGYLVSAEPEDFFPLMFKKPRLLVFVDRSELARLTASDERRFALTISGRPVRLTSANVIGEVAGNAGASRQIIVSAHLDAYRTSPGASDNASGVGVLVELARHFKSLGPRLKTRVTLVGFGAEELGVLGSRAYVSKHSRELRDCVLNLNVDAIGGPTGPFVVTLGGVSGGGAHIGEQLFPPDLMDKAWEGLDGDWRLLDPRLLQAATAANRPEWIKHIVDACSNALDIAIEHTGNSGSDDLSFTQAGVPATSVGYGGGPQHSPEDDLGHVRKANLTTVGRLVACIVERIGDGSVAR